MLNCQNMDCNWFILQLIVNNISDVCHSYALTVNNVEFKRIPFLAQILINNTYTILYFETLCYYTWHKMLQLSYVFLKCFNLILRLEKKLHYVSPHWGFIFSVFFSDLSRLKRTIVLPVDVFCFPWEFLVRKTPSWIDGKTTRLLPLSFFDCTAS